MQSNVNGNDDMTTTQQAAPLSAYAASSQTRRYIVEYDTTLRQYVVTCGELRVVPTVTPHGNDPYAMVRAWRVAGALNRVYAAGEAQP